MTRPRRLSQTSRTRTIFQTATIVLFALALVLPVLVGVLGLEAPDPILEKRRRASLPPFRADLSYLLGFPERFEPYFNDHFGLRSALIRTHNSLKVGLFGVSPSPKVMLGKDGWLFFAGDRVMDYVRGTKPFGADELQAWEKLLRDRNDWIVRRGGRYVFLVAPNKHTIYPEMLPSHVTPSPHESRLDALLTHMSRHATAGLVEPRAALLAAKRREQVYFRTDTHWNDLGAFIAYRELVGHLGQRLPVAARPRAAFPLTVQTGPGGDLASMLAMNRSYAERRWLLGQRSGSSGRVERLNDEIVIGGTGDRTQPRAVMFHDSFGVALIPFLAPHFSRIVCAEEEFDEGLVEAEQPDIVIEEMAERYLMREPR